MNYIELQQAVADWAHRTDLGDQLITIIDNASQRLGERFGVMPAPLTKDTDTNGLLTTHPRLYLLACQVEVSIYTHDSIAAANYEQVLQEAISNMNINYQDTDWAACESPVICSESMMNTTNEIFPND